jgi:hypothetical protein
MYVNEWMSLECLDEGTSESIHNLFTHSHPSEEEIRTREDN